MSGTDEGGFIAKVIGPKRRWRQCKERAEQLPPNYRTAVEAIERYMIRTYRHHARPSARLRRAAAGDSHRQTIRDLFTQQPVGTDIWIALAWCVGILVITYIFATASYRRNIS
jgi:hypothetical protein